MPDPDAHLSQIVTLWSVVGRAHGADELVARDAKQELIGRYRSAVERYLRAALRSADAADEVFQEFALRFVRGDFHRADPEKGRFRYFVKTALHRLICDYHRDKGRGGRFVGLTAAEYEDKNLAGQQPENPLEAHDEELRRGWREELLSSTWKALEAEDERSGKSHHAVLRYRADHPEERSPQMAEALSRQLGREFTSASVRQALKRARGRFSEILLAKVADTLEQRSDEALAEELEELELMNYCRDALETRRECEEGRDGR